jgi:hypothetical protein
MGDPKTSHLRFLSDQGKKSSKKLILKNEIESEILSRDRVDMSTIGFEPKISSYIEAVVRRGLICSIGVRCSIEMII